MKTTRLVDMLKLIGSLAICQLAGFVGSILTRPSIGTWFATLRRPAFAPPNWLFSPVWIALYVLMGISAFIVWRIGLGDRRVRIALGIFLIQLVLNVLWSFFFFGLKSPSVAFIEIVVLWVAILWTILSFLKISPAAALLLVPYLLWVNFAAVLNFWFWRLNP